MHEPGRHLEIRSGVQENDDAVIGAGEENRE